MAGIWKKWPDIEWTSVRVGFHGFWTEKPITDPLSVGLAKSETASDRRVVGPEAAGRTAAGRRFAGHPIFNNLWKKIMKNVVIFTLIKFLHLFQQNMFSRNVYGIFLVFGTLENVIQQKTSPIFQNVTY